MQRKETISQGGVAEGREVMPTEVVGFILEASTSLVTVTSHFRLRPKRP